MSNKNKIIKEIKFSNIKGIDKKSFKFKNITNSEINVFVAPNGTGKSTFAFALKSIHANRLDIDPKDRNNKNLDSYVQIIFQDNSETKFTTKDVSNGDIKFDVFESSVKAIKKGKYQPGLKTEKITIVKNIPREITKKEKDKTIDDAKKLVEDIIKVRANKIIDLTKPEVIDFVIENYKTLEKYSLSTVQNFITSTYSKINKSKATNQNKHIEFEKDFLNSDISKVKELVSSYAKFKKDFIATTIVDFLVLCEVLKLKKISFFKDIRRSDNYKKFKEESDNLIRLVDTTNKNYSTYVKNNSLMFEVKDAAIVSNGERDILNLIANCRRLLFEFDGSSVQYLIIDDIFDYLDYGNLLYGYSILRDTIKSIDNQNFFVVWLTHISDDILKVSARKKDFKFTFYNEDSSLDPNNSDFYTVIKNRNY